MADWLVWSNEHGSWWRGHQSGYTRILEEAGRYTHAQAVAICEKASLGGQLTVMRDSWAGRPMRVPPEVAVPAPEIQPERTDD